MLKYEWKKLFSKRINVMFIIVMVLIAIVFSIFAIRSVRYFNDDETMSKSIGTVRLLSEEKNQWRGKLTPEVLSKVASENQSIYQKYGDAVPNDVFRQVIQPSLDIAEMIGGTVIGYDGPGDPAMQVTPKQARSFYDIREKQILDTIREYGKNSKQQNF